MDINSLLSPSESPSSPPKRPSLLRKAQSTSVTPSTTNTSIASHSYSGGSRDGHSSPLRTTNDPYHTRYQTAPPSMTTAGIDTLADVAALQQHHTSKPRALVAAEIIKPQNPLPSSYAALSTWQASPEAGDSRSTPARVFRTASLAGDDQEEIAKLVASISNNGFDYNAHSKLIELLHKGFVRHMEAGGAKAHEFELIDDLRRARKAMDDRFPVGESLWADWIADESLLARTLEERIEVMELCKRAVEEEVSSTRLWKIYGDWVQNLYENGKSSKDWTEEEQELARELFSWDTLIDVWRQAASATKWRLNDSNLIWDQYAELLSQDVSDNPTSPKVSGLRDAFINRLKTPHATWEQTFQQFSSFVTKYDNENYEDTMVHVTKLSADAKVKYEDREIYELKLQRAASDDELWAGFAEYLEFETTRDRDKKQLDPILCAALFERALLKFGVEASLWEDYVFFILDKAALGPDSIPILPILNRATRHCPWSGTLWSQYLLSAEKGFKPFHEIETIKHHATQGGLIDIGGLDEVLKVLSAWCGFLKRRAFSSTATEEEIDVAELGIRSALESANELGVQKHGQAYRGDPQMRLERIYIGFLGNIGSWDQARLVWESMFSTRGNDYSYWFRYYRWEMYCWAMTTKGDTNRSTPLEARPGPPTQATTVLRRAVQQEDMDWPDKIFETFINHVEDHEDVEVVQGATVLLRKQTKLLAQKRERAYAAGQPPSAGPHQAPTDLPLSAKRKWEDEPELENGVSKRSRTEDEAVDAMDTTEDGQAVPKRDREHTTVIIRHLPSDVTEAKIKRFFRECGDIQSVVIAQESNTATATIEFESEEGVLAAVTKDMKKFEGHAIQVKAGLATTLWVTNFPPTADQKEIRELFAEFGDVMDVRFPSLKFNTSRRFCYVQFRSASEAQAALALNGKDLGQKGTLVVKLSDPSRKEDRTGPIYDGREVYVSNVDWNAKEDDLRDIFAKYGKVERVRLPTNLSGKSKGMAFVTFASKDEADASLELNATKFLSRILTVQISEPNHAKRPGITSGRVRSSSPQLSNGHTGSQPSLEAPSASTIRSKTFAILGLPDTYSAARLKKILSEYGKLLKVQLRPDHGGAIIEFESVTDSGKAELALDGMEIEPGRSIRVGTVPQLLKEEGETKDPNITVPKKELKLNMIPVPRISRPTQQGKRGRGGLGSRRTVPVNGASSGREAVQNGEGGKKTNADFKAMFSASD